MGNFLSDSSCAMELRYQFVGVFHYSCFLMSSNFLRRIIASALLAVAFFLISPQSFAAPQSLEATATVPVVKKVEPPNWWIGLTPDLTVLLYGHRLQATKVVCNLPDVVVEHTEATQGGDYLFVWLKFGSRLRSGTIVCHLTTPVGDASFELPISNREPTAQRYHGYGAVDLYAVDPHLGTLNDYKGLASALRQQRMKLFFDAVPNHVGPSHPWVAKPPLPDWFHGTAQNHLDTFAPFKNSFYGKSDSADISNDPFEALTDPHSTAAMRRNMTDGWFFGVLPDLNTENPVVAKYLLQNSIWWIESAGLDGFRVDTFPYVSRTFWEYWHAGLRRLYPNLTTIGEVFHPDPTVTSFFVGGRKEWDGIDTGLSTVFDFPFYFTIRDVLLRGAPAGRIADILRQDTLYPHPDWLLPFFANHDVPRIVSEPGSSREKLLCAFGLILTLRGIPQLYYGDEIAMPGGGDPENRRDFPGGWPGDPQSAFTEQGRTPEQQRIFSAVQNLLQLRRRHPALRTGKLFHVFSDSDSYVFVRQTDDERLLVVFNNGNKSRTLKISEASTPLADALRATTLYGNATAESTGTELKITAPPQSISILSLD